MHGINDRSIQGIIFDWAGTIIDYGSRAPVEVFVEIFRQSQVDITIPEAREPMGRAKRDHIAAIGSMPRVAEAWKSVHGKEMISADVDKMYADFLPMQKAALARGAELIPGAIDTVNECRRRGLKIGSSTGYTRELMDVVAPLAEAAGYKPDCILTADDTAAGRPAPWMNFRAAEWMNVFPMSTLIAVDDTPAGIVAGRNADMWVVGVTKTGNGLGLSKEEVDALSTDELERRLNPVRQQFQSAGAHYVIDSVADLIPVVDEINRRLAAGQHPDVINSLGG